MSICPLLGLENFGMRLAICTTELRPFLTWLESNTSSLKGSLVKECFPICKKKNLCVEYQWNVSWLGHKNPSPLFSYNHRNGILLMQEWLIPSCQFFGDRCSFVLEVVSSSRTNLLLHGPTHRQNYVCLWSSCIVLCADEAWFIMFLNSSALWTNRFPSEFFGMHCGGMRHLALAVQHKWKPTCSYCGFDKSMGHIWKAVGNIFWM